MSDLVEFLQARLDEEEAAALAASPGPWHVNAESDEVLAVDGITVADGFALSGQQLRATTAHIARHDPARVLAEVEAKRKLIELHRPVELPNEMMDVCATCEVTGKYPEYPCATLRLLALPDDDHPDYHEAWRP